MFKKLLIVVGSMALLFGVGTALASAHSPGRQNIVICHNTGKNYIQETVDINGLDGHGNHKQDIIPPTDTYKGDNWDTKDQAIYNNDCHVSIDRQNDPCAGHEISGRCADQCTNSTDTLLGYDPKTGAAICKAAPTGCPYGDSIPLGPECDKLAPQPTHSSIDDTPSQPTPDTNFQGK